MQISKLLLMAAFGLITSALSANAQTTIWTVPYTISAPGAYVLGSNIASSVFGASAITINSPTSGKIILDLGGYTLQTYFSNSTGILIQANPASSSITVRNGVVEGGRIGVDVNPSANGFVSNIHIDGVSFIHGVLAYVQLQQTNSSSITNCRFGPVAYYNIWDNNSQTGNTYSNDTFTGPFYFQGAAISVSPAGSATLDRMHFDAP
jgi:hypothetical protein